MRTNQEVRSFMCSRVRERTLLCLFLVVLFIWIYKKRQSVKAMLVSVMKNEAMEGFQIGNEILDFAGDAVLYHSVATRYRYMHGMYVAYTIAFCLACLASTISLALKIKALCVQLRIRRNGFAVSEQNGGRSRTNRRAVLDARLDACRKDQIKAYAAVLCAALEDLPMGVLSVVLTSLLPPGEQLSVVNQLSIVYSWFNLGGKMLKAAGLPRLWAEEKDIRRKLEKPGVALSDKVVHGGTGFGESNRSDDTGLDSPAQKLVREGAWNRFQLWLRSALSRKHARQGDAELQLVDAFVRQELQHRSVTCSAVGHAHPAALIVSDTIDSDSASEPALSALVRLLICVPLYGTRN